MSAIHIGPCPAEDLFAALAKESAKGDISTAAEMSAAVQAAGAIGSSLGGTVAASIYVQEVPPAEGTTERRMSVRISVDKVL